ncbi:MAG: alpha/beta hydrolase, partial [Desulfobacterales bacterium]|nr:alpha/beta hydrolase [Desulfobacterales bacterium]
RLPGPTFVGLLMLVSSMHWSLRVMAGTDIPAPGLMVLVGEHRLHLHCSGQGEPAVVMDAGLGGTSLDWVRVQPELAKYTRVCTYDRAGYGWSELGPRPRSSGRIAEELRTLLHTAAVPEPYVLVGHSFGGYNVRLFASNYPEETAGLVLVDAAHEDQVRRFREEGGINTAPRGQFVVFSSPGIPDNMPYGVRPLVRSLVSSSAAYQTIHDEMISFRRSATQVRNANPLPDVPLVVITRGQRVWPDTRKGDLLERLWAKLQDDLAERQIHVPHLFAQNSGHYIQLDEPGVVVNAVRSVIASIHP